MDSSSQGKSQGPAVPSFNGGISSELLARQVREAEDARQLLLAQMQDQRKVQEEMRRHSLEQESLVALLRGQVEELELRLLVERDSRQPSTAMPPRGLPPPAKDIFQVIQDLELELERAMGQRDSLKADVLAAKREYEKEREVNSQLRLRISELEAQLSLAKAAFEETARLKENHSALARKSSELQSRLEGVVCERDLLLPQLAALKKEKEELLSERSARQVAMMRLEDTRSILGELQEELSRVNALAAERELRIKEIQEAGGRSFAERNAMELELKMTMQMLEGSREESRDLEQQLATLRGEKSGLLLNEAHLDRNMTKMRDQIQQLQASLDDEKRKNAELTLQINIQTDALNAVYGRLEDSKRRAKVREEDSRNS